MSFASISFTMLFQANFLFHNHLFDKFSCSTPKHILLNYLPKYRFDHAMLPKNKPLVSSQHTHSPPHLPLFLSQIAQSGFQNPPKFDLYLMFTPPLTLYHAGPHADHGLTTSIYSASKPTLNHFVGASA